MRADPFQRVVRVMPLNGLDPAIGLDVEAACIGLDLIEPFPAQQVCKTEAGPIAWTGQCDMGMPADCRCMLKHDQAFYALALPLVLVFEQSAIDAIEKAADMTLRPTIVIATLCLLHFNGEAQANGNVEIGSLTV